MHDEVASNLIFSDNSTGQNKGVIIFKVTETMSKVGIGEFILNGFDFQFTLKSNRKCCLEFSPKKLSVSELIKAIDKKLYQDPDILTDDPKAFTIAVNDIEDQLIKKRDEIFSIPTHNGMDSNRSSNIPTHNKNLQKNVERIGSLRRQVKESHATADDWRTKLVEKYEYLHKLTIQLIPELWLPLEFAISVKSILNIKDWTLPFMAVLLAPPSSMKTVALDLLIDYPHTFTTDEFTPGAFVSHNSTKSEAQLQKGDMLPKMVNKLNIFPELAPLFTAKDEDLQKNFGKILRILDGKGFQSDSGAQGHRGYSGDMMLTILGAAVEIQYRVYRMFGNLGQKIYYLRLPRIEKTREERKEAAKQKNDHKEKVRRIKEALFDYLTWFDVAIECGVAELDGKSGLVKIQWDIKKEDEKEQDTAIGHISDLGELIAHLRGVVGTFESSKRSDGSRQQEASSYNSDTSPKSNSNSNMVLLLPTLPFDFENDLPIIEESSRAITHLKSVAMGHALSKGRNYITLSDIPIVIKVVLSTAPIARVRIFDLLLEHKGELTTSDIVRKLRISYHTAHRTMTELSALELVDKTAIGTYNNSEFKIKLRDKFRWFTAQEFEELREGFRPADYTKLEYREKITESSTEPNIQNIIVQDTNPSLNDKKEDASKCHMLASFLPPETKAFQQDNHPDKLCHTVEAPENSLNDLIINNDNDNDNKTNVPIREQKSCNHVTESLGQRQMESDHTSKNDDSILEQILNIIREANGSSVSVNSTIESVYRSNHKVRVFLGDKLTSRDNRKVRELCLNIIRHQNIEVVKHRPQLLVKWSNVDGEAAT